MPTTKLRFNGAFDQISPYKGPPSPAVDEARDKILPLQVMSISEETFGKLNASKHSVKLPEAAGGGCMALFESIHMIHCVRTLWEGTHPDYYLENDPYYQTRLLEWREHIDHCADILRQELMCEADTTLITYNWLKNHNSPHPNFNVQHTCRDYGRLLQLAKLAQVDVELVPTRHNHTGDIVDFEEPPSDPGTDS